MLLITLALLLPIIVGCALMIRLIPQGTVARLYLVIGYGTLFGYVALTLIMRLQNRIFGGLDFLTTAIVTLLLITAAAWQALADRRTPLVRAYPGPSIHLSAASKWLLAVFVVLIAVRVLSLVTAQLTTSFIPWDTSMHWATKSLVWFEHRQIVPFVEQAQWLERMSADVYTDHHPLYPRTIPLVQTWMALANNRWDYTIVGLPWTCWLIATGLLLFGQLRQRGLNTLSATVFVYLLLSLPLLNTHAVLTGYADLLSGALYGGCVMAFYGWCLDRQTWQLNTCVIAGLMCLTIKNEGLFWAATLIPGFLWVALPERLRIRTLTLGVCFVVATIIFIPKDLSVAGHTLQELNLHFRPAAIAGLIRSWYQLDNWHLLLWLISALICALIIVPAEKRQALAPLLVVVLSALILFIFLFTFTQYAWGAVRQTAVGRLNLHLIPALTFLAAMLWQPVIASLAQRASQGMPPPIAN